MGPIVDLEPMPNGDLAYVNIGFGSSPAVRRITYANGNLAPDPVATATPTEGLAPLQVQFTGSGSTDPEDDDLSYEWDFGDGTANSTAPDPTHLYTGAGVFTARLTVDDGFNRFPNTTVTISVGGNKAPVPSISAPTDESKYRGGATVQLAGSATDDGPPSEVDLSWQVLLHHNTHLHEVATPEGAAAAFATYVDHDADSYYEVILTASDSEGGIATRRIQIRPETIDLTLASSPAGAPILYSGQGPFAAPTQRSAAVGYQATVEAPNLFVFDGRSYEFDRWSDGGGRKHVVSVPASDSTLTASYRRQVPPETTITTGPSALTSDARPAFAFASDDPAARFECGLDEGPHQPCTSPFQGEPLGDGAHTFTVRATDPYVGTPDSTPSTRAFLVDSAAPHQARLRGSSPPSPANNNLPRVTGAAEAGSIVSLFGTRGCSGRPLASGAAAAFASRGLRIRVPSNALTKVRAVVTDAAGNRTNCSSDFVPYLEDSRRPRTRISAGPRGRTFDRTPTFWFRSDETRSRFRCRLDAGRWRHCGRQLTLRRPALGHHVLRVAAEDRAGNRGPVALRGFSVALRGKRDPTANSRLTIPLERRSGR